MISIRQLSKTFYGRTSSVKVLRKINLEVKKGEVFGLLGANGAGKTTAIKILVGLMSPDEGSVTINNLPAATIEAKRFFGFMSENPQFYQYLTAREVLEFAGELSGVQSSVLKKRISSLLKQVGLGSAADLTVRKFSKGMHQRLAFAAAMVAEPPLMILDEPLDGLDPVGRLTFKKLIKQWRKEGKTIFFSSHILADVEELCDRVAIIDRGQVLKIDTPANLVANSSNLEEAFVALVKAE